MKSELGIRPIRHQLKHRADAHILIASLAYCLQVTLKNRLQAHAPGLTAGAVLETLATIQILDVWFPTTDGHWLVMPRYTEPEPGQALLLRETDRRLDLLPRLAACFEDRHKVWLSMASSFPLQRLFGQVYIATAPSGRGSRCLSIETSRRSPNAIGTR